MASVTVTQEKPFSKWSLMGPQPLMHSCNKKDLRKRKKEQNTSPISVASSVCSLMLYCFTLCSIKNLDLMGMKNKRHTKCHSHQWTVVAWR